MGIGSGLLGGPRPDGHRPDRHELFAHAVADQGPGAEACRQIVVNDFYGYALIDAEGNLLWGTRAVEELLGYPTAELVGRNMADFLDAESLERAIEMLAELQAKGDGGVPGIWRVRHADGHHVHVEIGATDYLDDPAVGGIALRLRPYEAQRHLSEYLSALASAASFEQLLVPLVNATSCLVQDADVSLVYGWTGRGFSSAVTTRLPPALSGTVPAGPVERSAPPPDPDSELPWVVAQRQRKPVFVADVASLPAAVQAVCRTRGIQACWVLPVSAPPEADPVAAVVLWRHGPGLPLLSHEGALDHVTQLAAVAFERRHTEELLFRAARYDALTGIPNRMQFFAQLEADSHSSRREHLAVLYLDLDNFKLINDTYGHRVGDDLLTEVAGTLAANVRPGDLVARLGGDEFAVLCGEVRQTSEVTTIANRLIQALARPFLARGNEVEIGLSVGIARWGVNGTDHDTLVDAADHALYQAKRAGRGRWVLA